MTTTSRGNLLDGAASRPRVTASTAPTTRAWLTQLNDVISAASRRLFQSQLVLRAASEREIRAQLPELCALASSICRAAATSATQRQALRTAFDDPHAQWLSRGAVESGASGFFCHLLLRETAVIANERQRDDDEDEVYEGDGASRLVVQVLLDPVLKGCDERIVESGHAAGHRACEWRFEKPKYYAMVCASLWETLLPFLARAARQHTVQFGDVLNKILQTRRARGDRPVNCRFAQVAGFWRLLEAVGDAKTLDQNPDVYELLPKMLAFVVRWSVLCEPEGDREQVIVSGSDALVDPYARFYDLLLEKFLEGMQEFLFKCSHATRVTCVAFRSILELHLSSRPATSSSERVRFTALTAAACCLVKGLASEASELIKNQSSVVLSRPGNPTFLMVIGMVSHIDSMDVSSVLSMVHELLDRYEELSASQHDRQEILLWVMYVIVCRQQSLDATTNKDVMPFIRLQGRICAVKIEDLQLMPLHWMEVVWKVCLGMHDDEVAAFVEEARVFRLAAIKLESGTTPPPWEEIIQQVPARRLNQYPSVMAILGSPYPKSLKRTDLSPEQVGGEVVEKLVHQISKKRRRLRRDVIVLSEEHEESRQNALLLPEVMERISSFMSAKRLCRLSLVCRAFAGVTRSERLWKPLYVQLVRPLKVTCRHGVEYEHYWRSMYQAKYVAIKRMRSRQLAAARKARQTQDMAFCWHEDDHELRMSVTISSAQLCRECGCNQLFATNDAAKSHRLLHQKYRCPNAECREALTSASALKQHVRDVHPPKPTVTTTTVPAPTKRKNTDERKDEPSSLLVSDAADKRTFHCSVDGCSRSYKSLKWLQTHMRRAHAEDPTEAMAVKE